MSRSAKWLTATLSLLLGVMVFVNDPAMGQEQVELTILTHEWQPLVEWISNSIKEYERLNPHVTIHHIQGPIVETFLLQTAAGVSPDIVNLIDTNFFELVHQGLLAPAPDDVVADLEERFMPASWTVFSYGDDYFAYPTEAIAILPMANVLIFEEAGVDYPTTYRELVELQRRLTRTDPDGRVTQAATRLDHWDDNTRVQWWAMLLWGYGGDFFDEKMTHATFNSIAGVQSLESYVELSSFESPHLTFFDLNLALTFGGAHTVEPHFSKLYPDVPVRVLEPLKGDDGNRVTTAYFWGQTVSAASSHQREAWDFLKWLNRDENRLALLRTTGFPPVAYSNIQELINDPYLLAHAKGLEYGRSIPNTPVWAQVISPLGQQILRALSKEVSATEALYQAARVVDAILKEWREKSN